MHPTSILFALASAVALIHAAAIPQGPTGYDLCIAEYATIFAADPQPTVPECTGCFLKAVATAFVVYRGNSANVEAAKGTYKAEMARCRGHTADETYNVCIDHYAMFLETNEISEAAACTGCAGEAFATAFLVYGGTPANIPTAKDVYTDTMEECLAAQ